VSGIEGAQTVDLDPDVDEGRPNERTHMKIILGSPYVRVLPAIFLGLVGAYFVETRISGQEFTVGKVIGYAIIAYVILSFWEWILRVNAANKPLRPHTSEYLTPVGLQEQASIRPHIKGKIVLIDKNARAISTWQMELPSALRATRPDEVGTIVWIKERKEKVGEYVDLSGRSEGSAYMYVWDLTLIDKSIPAIVGRATLRGSDPPETSQEGFRSGTIPLTDTIEYLESLRRV
jgi:hypothetical protein